MITVARWEYIDKKYFDDLQRTGNVEGLLKAETENILLDNNTFWRAEHKQGIFDSLKNAFVEFGLDGCICRFRELVDAGKTGKLSIIGCDDIEKKPIERIAYTIHQEPPDYELLINYDRED